MCLHGLSRLAVARNASGMGRGWQEGQEQLSGPQLGAAWCLLCTWRAAAFCGSTRVRHGEEELFVQMCIHIWLWMWSAAPTVSSWHPSADTGRNWVHPEGNSFGINDRSLPHHRGQPAFKEWTGQQGAPLRAALQQNLRGLPPFFSCDCTPSFTPCNPGQW